MPALMNISNNIYIAHALQPNSNVKFGWREDENV
jgi:hypothetical protein